MMFNVKQAALCLVFCLIGLCSSLSAAELKSPDDVKTALRLIMQVTNDFDRQIGRKTYERLPHENEEFKESVQALRQSIATEAVEFKGKVESALHQAEVTAQKVADLNSTRDEAQLRAGQADLLRAVNALFSYFPKPLRPDPTVAPGRSGAVAPSPQ